MAIECPNCGSIEWLEGPEGDSQNISCAQCGNRYNLTPFGLDFIGVGGLPYIMNTCTKEREVFPTLAAAMREAKLRDEEIFESTSANTLSECPHWLAYNEDGVIMLDTVPAWRHFHPDRHLV